MGQVAELPQIFEFGCRLRLYVAGAPTKLQGRAFGNRDPRIGSKLDAVAAIVLREGTAYEANVIQKISGASFQRDADSFPRPLIVADAVARLLAIILGRLDLQRIGVA